MANMLLRVGLLSLKCSNRVVSRISVPRKCQGLYFHTSGILDVKGKPILMPSLSPTMESGTIVKWLKKEGENANAGDALADIETDKAVVTMEVDDDIVLAKIIVAEGTKNVKVGSLIAVSVEQGEDWKSVEMPDDISQVATPPASPAASDSPVTPVAPAASAPSAPSTPSTPSTPIQGQVYGLAVRRLLEEYNLQAEDIKGSGRGGRLLKSDVLDFIEQKVRKITPATGTSEKKPAVADTPPRIPSTALGTPSTFTDFPISQVRLVIANRLTESKATIPHSYATVAINIDKLSSIRQALKEDNIKVSVNDFIIKGVAHALLECPVVNSIYKNNKVVHLPTIDICVAVATPNGLYTPIVFNANSKSVVEISTIVKELVEKARNNRLRPEEFQGGSFTISNLGMFNIKQFSAIINPPQTAILAVGTGVPELTPSLQTSTIMSATLSYDRRAIDEDQASDFLAVLKAILNDPTFFAVGKIQALRHINK